MSRPTSRAATSSSPRQGKAEAIEAALEEAIEKRFGLDVPVIVRTAGEWAKLAASNPFAKAAEDEPNRLQLLVSKERRRSRTRRQS